MDALSALRQCIVQGRKLVSPTNLAESGAMVEIDGASYRPDTVTAYAASNKTRLDLATVVAFWEFGKAIWGSGRTLNYAEYVRHARDQRKSGFVLITDVEGLRDYLQGQSEGEGKLDQKTLQSVPEAKGPAMRTEPQRGEEDVWPVGRAMANEVVFKTRRSVLECGKALKDEVYKAFSGEAAGGGGGGGGGSTASSSNSSSGGGGGSKRPSSSSSSSASASGSGSGASSKRPRPSGGDALTAVKGTPIILVPSSASSVITIFNAKALLEDGAYVSAEAARAAHGNAERPTKVAVHRKDAAGRDCKYYVVDNPALLSSADWIKVVAVFAAGPEWQFKGWKWGKQKDKAGVEPEDISPVTIFSKVLGFHLYFEGDQPHFNATQWAVKLLPVSKTQRFLDKGLVARFWIIIDEEVRSRKQYLAPK